MSPTSGYPDGPATQRVNQFASVITGSTSTGATAFPFGFAASLMKLVIDSGGPAFLQLNGNAATTSDFKLSSSDLITDFYDMGIGISGLSVTPGTSTVLSMRIGAWGG